MERSGIPIVYLDAPVDGEKGLFSGARGLHARIGELDTTDLVQNLSEVCGRLAAAFKAARESAEAYDLEEFEVTLDLTASGEVRLIGSVSTELHGGLKLTFRRRGGSDG